MENLQEANLNQNSIISDEEFLKRSIAIEKELIEESGMNSEKWIQKYGEKFREVISKNPEIIKRKDKIKKLLEEETIH